MRIILNSLMLDTMKNGKYFANRWKDYKDAPEEFFIPHTYEDLMTWKVHNWQLKPGIEGVLRVRNLKTNKVKEYTYKQHASLQKKFVNLLHSDNDLEITISTNEDVATFFNQDFDYELKEL